MKKTIRKSLRAIQVERYLRYSIRKFSIGVASVAIAAGIFCLDKNVVAAEVTENSGQHEVIDESFAKSAVAETVPVEKQQEKHLEATKANLKELVKQLEELQSGVLSEVEEKQELEQLIAEAKAKLEKATEVTEVEQFIDQANSKRNRWLSAVNRQQNGTNSPQNGQPMAEIAGAALRSNPTSTVGEAQEGPTSYNKLGYKNNPKTGVFNSAKEQFGDIDFSNATDKKTTLTNQWNSHKTFAGEKGPVELGKITYNWKEKKVTKEEAEKGALAGWKIEGNQGYVTVVKPEQPTELADNRPKEYAPLPGKVYDNNGTIERKYENTNVGAGVNNAAQNYANGLDMQSLGRVDNLAKGYYLELGKKGNKIYKEFDVNGNSRLFLNVISGGAYGNAGTAATGERIKITLLDVDTNQEIPSIQDDLGGGNEKSHMLLQMYVYGTVIVLFTIRLLLLRK